MRRESDRLCYVLFFLGMLVTSFYISFNLQLARSYTFIPYSLSIKPGTNADDTHSYSPTIFPNATNPIIRYPGVLENGTDLGWSGDRIVDFNRSAWKTVAVGEDSKATPAILSANYGSGHIVYVTNPLAPFPRLVYNILAWHFAYRLNRTINIALMIDVPPVQILDDWDRCFRIVSEISVNRTLTIQQIHLVRIEQYQLTAHDLSHFDVLLFAAGWGDGYFASDWNWHSHHYRDDPIKNFTYQGGLLLLPEAGYTDQYGITLPFSIPFYASIFGNEAPTNVIPIPVKQLEDYLSGQPSALAMATLSVSAAAALGKQTVSGLLPPYITKKLNQRSRWITGYLALAATVWFIVVPLYVGQLLMQTSFVLFALGLDTGAIFLMLSPNSSELKHLAKVAQMRFKDFLAKIPRDSTFCMECGGRVSPS